MTKTHLVIFVVGVVVLWELIWKMAACWKAGRNNQIVWYFIVYITFSVGIFPIAYLLFFQNDKDDK